MPKGEKAVQRYLLKRYILAWGERVKEQWMLRVVKMKN